jgi:hypothetical protein
MHFNAAGKERATGSDDDMQIVNRNAAQGKQQFCYLAVI